MKSRVNGSLRMGSRQGVSLVIVLGFLSIMMLMAVSFAINMRVERIVSRSFLEKVRSDQLIDAALARALAEIEAEVGEDPYPAPADPDTFFFLSSKGEGGDGMFDLARIEDWLPLVLAPDVREMQHGEWELVDDDIGGEVAWFVVDCSGFLDPHVLFNEPRRSGMSVQEISPAGDGFDFQNNSEGKDFAAEVTDNWRRLYSPEDLAQAYWEVSDEPWPKHMFPFSYAPPDSDTIPVVLDQTDDGIYRYIDGDGNPAELPLASTWRNNRVPDWIDAYRAGIELDFMPVTEFPYQTGTESMVNLPHTFRGYLEEMLNESGALPFDGTRPSLPITSRVFDGSHHFDTLEKTSRIMTDYFTLYNLGRGMPIHPANTLFFARNHTDWNHSVWPTFQPEPWVTQVWANAVPAVDGEGNPIPNTLDLEATVEWVNPYQIPIDTTGFTSRMRFDMSPGSGRQAGRHPLTWYSNAVEGPQPGRIFFYDHFGGPGGTDFWCETNGFPRSQMDPGEIVRIDYVTRLSLTDLDCIIRKRVLTSTAFDAQFIRSVHYFELHTLEGYRAFWDHGDSVPRLFYSNDPRLFWGGVYSRSIFPIPDPGPIVTMRNHVYPDPLPPDENFHHHPTYAGTDITQTDGNDGTHRVYIPERDAARGYPVLDSLAHIGRQPLNNRWHWRSIPLVGENAVDVARFFAMTNEPVARKGRININSPHREVLAAGFLGANTDMSGSATAATAPLSRQEALNLADLILDDERPAEGFRNVVDVLRARPRSKWEDALGGRNKFEVEEILMRSRSLFTTRQQIYTLFLAGRTQRDGQALADARAVAVVWRDPFRTDTDGRIVEPDEGGYDDARHRIRLLHFSHL